MYTFLNEKSEVRNGFNNLFICVLDKFEDGNKTTNKGNKIERKVVFIHITKTPPETLGLVIVGGQDSKRLTSGIYIKHIKPNSVCELDGRLNEG